MVYVCLFLGGVITGIIITNIITMSRKSFGVLKIDPKEDVCQVCLNTSEVIQPNKKTIILRIDHNADLSQK